MSLLQLFIQAIKGEPPPPPTSEPGDVGLRAVTITAVSLADQARAGITLSDHVVGAVALSDAPVNPG